MKAGFLGSAPVTFSGPSVDAPNVDDEAAEAQVIWGFCSASSELSPTGIQWARVSVSPRDPMICIRETLGGAVPQGTPNCWVVAHQLGCESTHDVD